MKHWRIAVVLLALLWTVIYSSFDSFGDVVGNILIGLVVGLIAVYPFRALYRGRISIARFLRGIPAFLLYLLVFGRDVVLANVDVAQRVLLPWKPIEPRVLVVPLRVESEYGVATIANSITLTPGTLTMDYDSENNALVVHSMSGEDIMDPIRTWEELAIKIFDGGSGE